MFAVSSCFLPCWPIYAAPPPPSAHWSFPTQNSHLASRFTSLSAHPRICATRPFAAAYMALFTAALVGTNVQLIQYARVSGCGFVSKLSLSTLWL